MRLTLIAAGTAFFAVATTGVLAQEEDIAVPLDELPREQTLILENPEGTVRNPGWFNVWAYSGGGNSTGMHQLATDTLWFIDPESGIDGVIYNALAAEAPIYNDDYTEMTVNLREGIYWSDGEPFTAEDVVFTVETQMADTSMVWGARFASVVEEVRAEDDHTVVFTLQRPNARFHSLFSVRWNGAWIMPAHVFGEQDNPSEYAFDPPVSLGPYTLHSYDTNGSWYIWEKREDWERTSMAEFGEPAPQYVIYRDGGPSDRRVISMQNGELDVIHDIAPEGMFALAESTPTARGWFDGFPYAHPDPTLPMVILNHQDELFQDRRVRWALALMVDIRAVSMASYRGAATISAIAIPPTGTHPRDYHEPMEEWLTNYELDLGNGETVRPYNPEAGAQIAEMLRPTMGDQIPTDEAEIAQAFGRGWWNQDLDAAAALLEDAGFTRQGDQWLTPEGEPFRVQIMVEGDPRPIMTRAGTMIAQNWRNAGVDASTTVSGANHLDRLRIGDFQIAMHWSVETWGGHPDLSFFLDSWHSDFLAEPGSSQPPRNWQRWSHEELDRIIEEIRTIDFDDERNIELGREYVELMVQEMPNIPLMAYNVFSVVNERYWTGFPTAANPYANPVSNWANSRYMMPMIEPIDN